MNEAKGKKRQFFGTDGVRDIANQGMMTPDAAMRLGSAYAVFLMENGVERPKIAVGRDTRLSGEMLQSALMAGIASSGGDAVDLGVIPTPGVSSAALRGPFSGGAVVSASHNPAEYNGIKFLDGDGFKLTDDDEAGIEEIFLDDERRRRAAPEHIGTVRDGSEYRAGYVEGLGKLFRDIKDRSYPIVIDAANGAASSYVGPLFSEWSGGVTFMANDPDGTNINKNVGVTHIETLAAKVCETGAAIEKEMYAPVKVPESMTVEDALEFLEVLRFMQEYDYWAPKAYRDSYGKLRERITQTLRQTFSERSGTVAQRVRPR